MNYRESPTVDVRSPARLSLKERLKFLGKDFALYGTAVAASRLFSLVTFPLLTRYFSTENYGLIDAFMVLTSLLTTLVIFGQDSAVARFFYEYEDTESRRQVISQSFFVQMITIAAVIPFLWIMADSLAAMYTGKRGLSGLCRLVVAQVPFALLVNFSQNLLKWTFSRIKFLIISIGSMVVSVVLILCLLLTTKADVTGVFWVMLANQVLFGLLGIYFCRHWIVFPRGMGHLKSLLSYGSPYGMICVIAACVPALDRFFISRFLGIEQLGLYAVGYKIAFLLGLLIQAFQTAWGPFSLAIFKEENAGETYDHVQVYFTISICLGVLLLSFAAEPIIVLLASARYSLSSAVVFPLALGLGLQAIGWIPSIGIDLAKKSYLKFFAILASMIITIGAIWILIPLGIAGVAWGVCLGYASQTILQTWMAYKAYPLRLYLYKPILLVAVTVAGGLLGTSLKIDNLYAAFMLRVMMLLLIMGFVWVIIFTQKERSVVLRFCRLQRS